jgi:hypothetical protein
MSDEAGAAYISWNSLLTERNVMETASTRQVLTLLKGSPVPFVTTRVVAPNTDLCRDT